jgi:hypothetical protein
LGGAVVGAVDGSALGLDCACAKDVEVDFAAGKAKQQEQAQQ